jgi:hypothetical protein
MIEIQQDAVLLYVALLKEKFGNNLPKLIEDLLYDSMNMRHFKLPSQWNDEEYIKWAKMDLEWNASEGGEQVVDDQLAIDVYKSNLYIDGIEDYFKS